MPQLLRPSPRTFKQSKTRPHLTHDRPNFKHGEAIQALSRKRLRTSFDLSQSGKQSDDRFRSLEEENKNLKKEIRDLKKKLKKDFSCPICSKLYSRSDGIYKHLQEGDAEHKRLAQERYPTTCEICGKECTRWSDLKKHMATHEPKILGSADNSASHATMSASPNSLIAPSTTEESMSGVKSLPINEDLIPEVAWAPDISTPLISENMVQPVGDQTTSCPPVTLCLKQALGFSKSPARGLDFTSPDCTHLSLYNNNNNNNNSAGVQAPGLLNNPARGLDFTPSDCTYPSLYNNSNTAGVQAPGFLNNPAGELDFTLSNCTYPMLYNNNTVSVQTLGFSNNHAHGLDFALSGSTLSSHDNDSLQNLDFSHSPPCGSDFAPSKNTRPLLCDNVALEAPRD